jgi:ribosomal protein L40E/uncharacterized protein YceK
MKKIIFLIILLFSVVFLSGCISIDSISQPSSAKPGDYITTTIQVSLLNNTSGGSIVPAFGVKIPNDWTVSYVSYSGTGGASGKSDYVTAPNTSVSSDLESKYPSGDDYMWLGYAGREQRVDILPAGATITIRMRSGTIPGSYNITYSVGYYFLGKWYWANNTTAAITLNNPPETPIAPSGPSSGTAGTSYTYSTQASDPNGDTIAYTFDWGDGTISTTDYAPSGTPATAAHTWSSAGTYNIKARAIDSRGGISPWSPPLIVIISLPPAVGSISITCFPSGAEVLVDGVARGNATPTLLLTNLTPGSHTVKCTLAGYADNETTVNVTAGETSALSLTLSAIPTPTLTPTPTPTPVKPTPPPPQDATSLLLIVIILLAAVIVAILIYFKFMRKTPPKEKKRFCMHCGTSMPLEAEVCPKCGKTPPSGVDVKTCKNCNAVIPIVAKFCAECGASQPA